MAEEARNQTVKACEELIEFFQDAGISSASIESLQALLEEGQLKDILEITEGEF